uniref:Uncharacterized protein n=1 Tax=Anguilla anguilla TaxID=7936 RepID=A0A0E9VK74_ANGAN
MGYSLRILIVSLAGCAAVPGWMLSFSVQMDPTFISY